MTVLRTVTALSAVAIAMTFAPGASAQGLPGIPQVDLNPAVPAIQGGGVTVLGPSTAIVRAGVVPSNLLTQFHVEYGESLLLGQSTPAVSVAAGGDPLTLLQELTSLKPGTTYYYRVVAQNADGTTTTTTNTFQTPPEMRG